MSYLPNQLQNDTVVSLTRVQQNDAALDTAISGNLTQANLSSATSIPNSMLANSTVEFAVNLHYFFTTAATTGLKYMVPLPGSGTYTIQNVTYAIYNPAAATPTTSLALTGGTPASGNTFVVQAGTITAGAWVVTNTILNTTQFYTSATAQLTSGSIVTSTETAPIAIAINVTAVNTPPTNGGITIGLRLTRALQ